MEHKFIPPQVSADELLQTIRAVTLLPESAEKSSLLKTLAEALQYVVYPAAIIGEQSHAARSY